MYLEEILSKCEDFQKETLTIAPQDCSKLKFWNGKTIILDRNLPTIAHILGDA